MVLQSVKSVLALMMLIAAGFYFSGRPWFGKTGMDFLSRFTVEATIPFYMFYNIYRDIESREALLSLMGRLPVTFGVILLCIGLAALAAWLLKIRQGRRCTFITASGFPNVVFIGFPVIQSLWGERATTIGVVYYISSTVLFWTIGVWLLARDGAAGTKAGDSLSENLKKLFSPAVIGMLVGMAAVFFRIPVPDVLMTPLAMISGVTSPLALIFIGSVIRNMDKESLRFDRDLLAALIMRFFVVPAAAALFLKAMPVSTEMKEVFFMLSTMPAMTQMGIMAREYGSDYEFACTVITVTTLAGMVTIPVFMYLMQTVIAF